jgi:hypothetical protein
MSNESKIMGRLALVVSLAACGSSTEPSFPRTIGAFCTASQHSDATLNGTDWDVSVYYNTSHDQIVTDPQGVLRTQTVRGCAHALGPVPDSLASTSVEAVAYFANFLGVTPA